MNMAHTENKFLTWLFFALAALLFLWGVLEARGEESIIKGEKINCWTVMTERTGQAFSIQSSTMEVTGRDGSTWQTETTATINGGTVYGLIDSTWATFTAGNEGFIKFKYYITPEIYIFKIPLKITD